MRLNFALTTLIAFVVLFSINLDRSYSQELVGEDERIIITVESVERADAFPEKLKEAPMAGYTTTYNPPGKGNDYVLIHITVVEKRNLKIESSEYRLTKTLLIDDRGETCRVKMTKFYVSVGSNAVKGKYLLYEMPKDASPVQLKYHYDYREKLSESQEIKTELIAIELSKIQ